MIRTVIDSTVLIDASRNHGAAIRFLEDAASRGEVLSITPVRTEMLGGMRSGEEDVVERLLGRLHWIDITVSIADRAGAFGRRFGKSHGLGVIDALLAAAADELGADLATRNIRDFPMFPGLQPPY